MKKSKRVLSVFLAIVVLISVMGIAVEAASVYVSKLNLGYMAPTNSKGTKTLSKVTLYGDYDYINFYVNSKKNNVYFGYEIYEDSQYTQLVDSGVTYCDKGKYNIPAKVTLKGNFSTKTYYLFTYAAYVYSDGSIDIDEKSMREYKISVKRSASYDDKVVVLKKTKNTTKGVYITWSKLSGTSKYYIYRRSLTGTKWTKVGTVSSSKSSFTDTSIKNKNGKYVYTVKGVNKKGVSSRYLYFGLTSLYAKSPVLKSVAVSYNNAVQIKWGSTSSSAKYDIYRKEGSGSWKKIKSNYSGTTYKDTTAKNNKKYTYTIRAKISTSNGTATSSYYANSDKVITYLKAPSLKKAVAVKNGVNVSWKAVSGAKGYTVYRKPLDGSSGWKSLKKVGANVTSYIDTTASITDGEYVYTVRSEAANNRGSYNNAGVKYIYVAPETTEPDTTNPDVTNPDVTAPDVTAPDVTEPTTEPATEPVTVPATEPETTNPAA